MSTSKTAAKNRKLQSEHHLSPRRKTRRVSAAAGFRKVAKRASIEEDPRIPSSELIELEPEQPEEIDETLPSEADVDETPVSEAVHFEPSEVQDDDTPPEEFEEEEAELSLEPSEAENDDMPPEEFEEEEPELSLESSEAEDDDMPPEEFEEEEEPELSLESSEVEDDDTQPEEFDETLPSEADVHEPPVRHVARFEPSEAQDDDTQPEEFEEEEAIPRAGVRAVRARAVRAAARRRTPAQVVAWAKSQHDNGSSGWAGMCLKFARMAAGAPGGTPNAKAAWSKARFRHTRGTPPAGSFVFWGGGTHGHVAVSIGGGHIWSTDIRRRGRIDRVTISYLNSRWRMPYLGWTEDVNGVRILGLKAPPPSKGPSVSLANLKPGKRNADVKTLQLVLRSKGYTRLNPSGPTGLFGSETRAMVRAFQKAQGWSGADADGVPGPKTCARLGLALK